MTLLALLLSACVGDVGDFVFVETGFAGVCGDTGAPLDADPLDTLAPRGCRWRVSAVDADAGTRLLLDAPVFAAAMTSAPAQARYALPDGTVSLVVETGCGLDLGLCGGSDAGALVSRSYAPLSGSLEVSVRADGDALLATVVFSEVVLDDGDGHGFTIASRTWSDIRLSPADG